MSGSILKRRVVNLQQGRKLHGIVTDVVRDRVTVQLSTNGRPLRGISYSGGPVSVGDSCIVDYSSGEPVAFVMGRTQAQSAVRRAISTRRSARDLSAGQLTGENSDSAYHKVSSGGALTKFPADYMGLLDALASMIAGDTIEIFPGVYTGNVTFTDGITVRGAGVRIDGTVTLTGDNINVYELTIWNIGTSAGDLICIEGPTAPGGALLTGCALRAINSGTGNAYGVHFNGARVLASGTYIRAIAENASAKARCLIAAGPIATVTWVICIFSHSYNLDDTLPSNWDLAEGVIPQVMGCSYPNDWTPHGIEYMCGDRASRNHTHTLLELSDVPDAYTGQAGKFLKVAANELWVEFADASSSINVPNATKVFMNKTFV